MFLYHLLFSIIVSVALSKCHTSEPQAIYVSTEGNDSWSGLSASPNADSTDGPLATVYEAVNRLKKYSSYYDIPPTIYIREGSYFFQQSLVIDSLTKGTEKFPLVIQNYNNEKVAFTGSKIIQGFQPVRDTSVLARIPEETRPYLRSISLKEQGISDFGQLTPGGFPRPKYPVPLELFFNNKPMPLARWPNDGWARIHQQDPTVSHFYYSGDRPQRWLKSEDAWLHGFWSRNWADSFVEINRIDTAAHKIETIKPHGTYGYAPNGRWYALNLLEEIDQPGEWFLDRSTGVLYFWPPAPVENHTIRVSISDHPFVILDNTSYVTLKGITFEMVRGKGVLIQEGAHNTIAKSTFRNIGNVAVTIEGGKNNGIIGSDFYDLGAGGVMLEGGDRASLTPGKHYVINCHFHHLNRWIKSGRPAISLSGVGHRIHHNLIHDVPHTGIHLYGNNHEVSYNEIFRAGTETGDVGAFYMGRDLSMQGNTIQYNYFHDLSSPYQYGVKAVYLDDFAGGAKIHGNIFRNIQQGILVNGGSGNIITQNLFVRAQAGVVIAHRAESSFQRVEKTLRQRLDRVSFRSEVWQQQYPDLVRITDGNPEAPMYNTVRQNITLGSNCLTIRQGDKKYQIISDNTDAPLNLIKDLFTPTHAPIPSPINELLKFDSLKSPIGLYQDALRSSWPNLDSLRTNY